MNSRSAERKRRLLILRNQRASTPETCLRPGVGSSDDQALITEFMNACGGGGLPRLSISGGDLPASDCIVLEKPYVVLGRSPDCDIRLTDPDVSFRHAYLQLVGGRLLGIDLASNTGTYFGTHPRHSAWLDAGATASIGPYALHYLGDQRDVFGKTESQETGVSHDDEGAPQSDRPNLTISPASRSDQPHNDSESLPEVSLMFLNAQSESSRQRIRPITRPVTLVGGSQVCKLTLIDETVSRVHCSLVLTPQGLWIIDLLGRDGTKVDGNLIGHQRLDDGNEISIGRFRFGVRYGALKSPQAWAVPMQPFSTFPPSLADEPSPQTTNNAMATESGPVSVLANAMTESAAINPVTAVSVPEGASTSGQFSEQFVLSLVNQFATMQQQMFDQTQQQMMMLTQMFGAMYQSQQEAVREDLKQIHTLTAEMQHVQSRLLESQVTAESQGTADSTNLLTAQSPPVDSVKGLTAQINPPTSATPNPGVEASSDAASNALTSNALTSDALTSDARSDGDGSDSVENDSIKKPSRSRADVDTHAKLTERMSRLEQERSGRWKKIMQTLSGAGS